MDNTPMDGASGVSPTPQASDKGSDGEFSLAADKSIADNFKDFQAHKEGKTAKRMAGNKDSKEQPLKNAKSDEADSDQSDSQNLENSNSDESEASRKGNKESHGLRKRVDTLTARNKTMLEESVKQAKELERYRLATEYYQKELERVSKHARLDHHQEELHSLRLQQELRDVDQGIDGRIEASFAEKQQEFDSNQRAQEYLEDMKSAVSEWSELFSVRELGNFMLTNNITDVKTAARTLGQKRELAWQNRSQRPKAPSAVASVPTGSREDAEPFKYQGPASIKKFMEDQDRRRRGQ
jgi:hypothetical protein